MPNGALDDSCWKIRYVENIFITKYIYYNKRIVYTTKKDCKTSNITRASRCL